MLCSVYLAVQTYVPSRVSLSVQVGEHLGGWVVAGREDFAAHRAAELARTSCANEGL